MTISSTLPSHSDLRKTAGIFDCLYDEYFTLIGNAFDFCTYLGYTVAEFNTRFHGHLVDIIYEEDRNKVLKEIKSQLAKSNVFMYENRIVTQSGELRWVWISAEIRADAGRGPWFHCTFHDITEEKNTRHQLAISEQRYEIVMSHTQDIIFELDCETFNIYYSPNFETKFGYSIPIKGFPDSMFATDIIFESDKKELRSQFQSLLMGGNEMTCEYRLKKQNGAYIWVEVRAAAIRASDGALLKIIGIIKDINDRKQEILEIRRVAVLDPLTSLYNRREGIHQIEEYIRLNDSKAAFLLFDIDNLKKINDAMGHAYGDMVLLELAAGLRTLFRRDDILIRLDGDEFIVFMTEIKYKDDVVSKVNHFLDFSKQTGNGPAAGAASCSIGCSLYPEHGNTFSILFQKADAAMYQAKKRGKAQFALFEESKIPSLGKNKDILPVQHLQKGFHDHIIEYAFRVFLENPENLQAIPLLLEQIGNIFHADRIYIYEKSKNGSFSDTYEWSAPGIPGLKASMNSSDSTMLWCETVTEPILTFHDTSMIADPVIRDWFVKRGVMSAAACFLREKEELLTVIIYEDCQRTRRDSDEEQYTLFMVSEIIHLFLNKERNRSHIWNESKERVSFLMDCIAGGMIGCYLEDGFPLYFINSRMLEFLGYESQAEYNRTIGGIVINSVFFDDRKRMESEIKTQLKEKNEYETDFRMVKKDGTVIWVNEKGRRTTTADGREAVISLGIDITLQKEYENQLALYRKASSGGAFIIRLDAESTLLYGNDIFYHMFEITKEEMAKRNFYANTLIHPDDLPAVQAFLEEALLRHSADCQWEMKIVTGKGNIKWFLVNGTFEFQKEGLVMNGFITDRTEKHLLEQELVHKELVYRTALEETHFKVWEYDVKTHSLILGRQVREEFPYGERLERIPDSLMEAGLIHPGSQQDVIDMYQQLDQGNPYVQADILSRFHRQEDWRWQRIRYTMVYDEQGNPDFAVAVGEDITRQKEAEMQYQQELQLRMAFNDSLIASFRCNLNTNQVEYAEGPSIERFAPGMCYEKLMEIHNQYMDNPEDTLRLKKLMGRKALFLAYHQGKTSLSFEYRRKDKSGRLFWVCASTRLVKDVHNGCLYAYGTLQDIHEKKLLELTMKNRAEHDMMSGAYNKDTAIQMITDSLEKAHRQKGSYAFLSFNIDHFAQIVHTSGYGVADNILKEVAGQLMMRFTNEKIVGKFYGDEFIVYIYNNPKPEMVNRSTEEVCRAIAMPYMFPDAANPVSLSVGIVFDNNPASTFASLYRKAHLALAASRSSGQSNVFVYSDSLEGLAYLPEKEILNESLTHRYTESGENLLLKCMYSLSGSMDFRESLNNILKELGNYYQSDRVYVIELNRKEQKVHSVYEWHRDDVPSIRNSDSMLLSPKEISKELFERFHSLRYEKDIEQNKKLNPKVIRQLKELGIQSYFLATLDEEKLPIGYIGVDNPKINTDNHTVLNALRYVLANELTKHRLQEKQEYLSFHDELTGVFNRYSFREYREGLSEEGLISVGVVSLDINGLKKINQKHGNSYGDDMICYVVRLIKEEYDDCRIYRLAGDEFLIICENISSEAFNQRLGRLKQRLQGTLSVCIGSSWSDVDIHLDSLINSADEKRIIAKQTYYNDIQFDSGHHNAQMRNHLLLALKQNHFFICLQPKVDSRSNQVCGAEALIRYQDSTIGLVPPGKFVPYLENAGLIHYIDFFVLEQVCITLNQWKEKGLPLIPISLNFSRSTLLEDNLIARMEKIVNRYHTDRNYLEIEITESLGEVERDTITRIGNQISHAGYQIALDDFGAKYSNISFLSMLHFHHLKLDKGLVNNLITNENARLIVKNIMNLCRELQVNVIAEGVESEEQLKILKNLECYFIQGYYYDKPVTVSAFEERYQKS